MTPTHTHTHKHPTHTLCIYHCHLTFQEVRSIGYRLLVLPSPRWPGVTSSQSGVTFDLSTRHVTSAWAWNVRVTSSCETMGGPLVTSQLGQYETTFLDLISSSESTINFETSMHADKTHITCQSNPRFYLISNWHNSPCMCIISVLYWPHVCWS